MTAHDAYEPIIINKLLSQHLTSLEDGELKPFAGDPVLLKSKEQVSGVVLNLEHLEDMQTHLGLDDIKEWEAEAFRYYTKGIRNSSQESGFARAIVDANSKPLALYISVRTAANFIIDGGLDNADPEFLARLERAITVSAAPQAAQTTPPAQKAPPRIRTNDNDRPTIVIEKDSMVSSTTALREMLEKEQITPIYHGKTNAHHVEGFFVPEDLLKKALRPAGTRTRNAEYNIFARRFGETCIPHSNNPRYVVQARSKFGNTATYVSTATMKVLVEQGNIPVTFSPEMAEHVEQSLQAFGTNGKMAPVRKTPSEKPAPKITAKLPGFDRMKDELITAFRDAVSDGESSTLTFSRNATLQVIADTAGLQAAFDAARLENREIETIEIEASNSPGKERLSALKRAYNLFSQGTDVVIRDGTTSKEFLFEVSATLSDDELELNF